MASTRRFGISALPLLFLVLFFAGAYIVYPLYALVKESLYANGSEISGESYRDLFRPSLLQAMFNSVAISVLSVIGSAIVGTFFAYVFTFFEFRGKRILSKLVFVPLALPPLVGVISFMFLVGESGMLSRSLSWLLGIPSSMFALSGWTGIVLVHIYSFYVYFYLFVSTAFAQLDGNALDASSSLGAARSATLRRVLLPMLMPALIGASLMTFMASMASFSAPFLFGGTTRFLTLEIYSAKLNGDNSSAAALAVLLASLSVCVLLLLRWWQSHRHLVLSSKGTPRAASIAHGRISTRIVVGVTLLLIIFFALPILTIVVLSLVEEGSWTYQMFPSSFTANNYLHLFKDSSLLDPFVNSLRMAFIATAACIAISVTASYLAVRKRYPGNRLVEGILSLPFGIPGTVIAVGLILAFNHPSIFSFQTVLVGTAWIMPLAYAVRNVPLLYRSTTAGLDAINPALHEAAESLGSPPLRTFRKIILPIILPSVASGALLVFINSVGEFVSSILLYSYSTKPISIEILSQLRLFNIGAAAMFSTLLMVLVLVAVIFSNRFFRSTFTA